MKNKKQKEAEPRFPIDGMATIPEAAIFLSCSKVTVYRMFQLKTLKPVTVGKEFRIPWKTLHELCS